MSPPVLVVGAGFGGLSAAVALASAGVPVLVVEQGDVPGGKAQSVALGGTHVSVGPTVLTMRWVFDELFAEAGASLESSMRIARASTIARHTFDDGSVLDLFSDVEASADAIGRLAGAREAKAYRVFAAYAERIANTVVTPFLRAERPTVGSLLVGAGRIGIGALTRIDAFRSMWSAICAHFDDARLRALFARYATYVGSSPFEAPATMNLVSHVEREGVSLVEGGIPALARGLADLALARGVEFRWGAKVVDVQVANGRVVGASVEHRSGARRERETLPVAAVIANADVATVAAGHLGAAAARAVPAPARARRSLSALTWALVGNIEGEALAHHHVFFPADYPAEHDALFRRGRMPEDPTVYVCAEDRGLDLAPPAKRSASGERLFVVLNAPPRADQAPLGAEEIDRCERKMRERLARGGIRLATTASHVMGPRELEQRFPGTGGAIYGESAHGATAALTRPAARTKLPGFFLAGGSVHPGPGVPMAALSGRTAARALLADLASTARSSRAATAGSISTP